MLLYRQEPLLLQVVSSVVIYTRATTFAGGVKCCYIDKSHYFCRWCQVLLYRQEPLLLQVVSSVVI